MHGEKEASVHLHVHLCVKERVSEGGVEGNEKRIHL